MSMTVLIVVTTLVVVAVVVTVVVMAVVVRAGLLAGLEGWASTLPRSTARAGAVADMLM